MQLSSGEKLILVMLSEVYEELSVKGEIDSTFIKAAILDNQIWGLDWKYSGLIGSNDDASRCRRNSRHSNDVVGDRSSVAKLTESEKSVIKEACPFGEIRFEGFDANQDSHFAIAQFLIKDWRVLGIQGSVT